MDTKVEKLDFLDYYFYPTNFQTHIGLKVKQAKMKGAQYVLSAQQAGHMTFHVLTTLFSPPLLPTLHAREQ